MEDERVVQQDDYLRLSISGHGDSGVRRWYGATTRDAICKRPRHALSDGASKGDTGKCSKEGPGRRGGMITGGQKQTSVWDANNTRAEGGEEEGGGGEDGGL